MGNSGAQYALLTGAAFTGAVSVKGTNPPAGDFDIGQASSGTITARIYRGATTNFGTLSWVTGATEMWSFQLRSDSTNDFHFRNNADGVTAILLERRATAANISFLTSTKSYGSGVGVIFRPNASTPPSTNPTGGAIDYVESGVPKARTSGGAVLNYGLLDNSFPMPVDHGFKAWSGDPSLATATTTTNTGGTVYLSSLFIRGPMTITKLYWINNTGGSGATAGQNEVGIYSSAGTRLASVNVDSMLGSGMQTATISSTSLTAGQYWVAAVFNASGMPGLARTNASLFGNNNANLTTATMRYATNATGQTTLPASITPASNSTTNAVAWWCAAA